MCLVNNKSIIFGTGFISENGDLGGKNFESNKNKIFYKPYNIIAVRGPLTRNKLLKYNINCPENYGDPLILFPCIYNKFTIINENIIGIIPHYVDKNNENIIILQKNLNKKGFKTIIIDIECGINYNKFIDDINKCKYIISSSLHGVIMGILYKKKTIFLKFSNKVIGNYFKFNDFFLSINVNYEHKFIYDENILNNVINIDYNNLTNLTNLGKKLIQLIPFIDEKRKIELIKIYNEFYL